jgi:WYL domain-containing protein
MSNLAQERQKERLKYIDLCAYILGYSNRKSLMNRFDIKQAWATKDFAAYQEKSKDMLVYDHALRAYKPKEQFAPMFEHSCSQAIELLTKGTQRIICEPQFAERAYNYEISSVEPKLDNIHCVLQALYLNKKVEIDYISRSSGRTTRMIAPHTLISTGCFKYVRAFDYKTCEFRSFKLNRVIQSKLTELKPSPTEIEDTDEDWNQDVELTIVCNDALENKEAIEYDFGLIDGKLVVKIKKAMIMYFLMDWNIAPTEHPELPSTLFPLKLDSAIEMSLEGKVNS